LALIVVVVVGRNVVAIGELLSFLDGPLGSVNTGASVVDREHAGVTRVVDEAAAHKQTHADFCSQSANCLIIGIEDMQAFVVELDDQKQFEDDRRHSNQFRQGHVIAASHTNSSLKNIIILRVVKSRQTNLFIFDRTRSFLLDVHELSRKSAT